MDKFETISLGIIALSFVVGIYIYLFYPMPDNIAGHWDINNEVNGYIPKFWGIFLMPLLGLGIYILFKIIPMIDPRKNIEKFKKQYNELILSILAFFFYIYTLTIVWNMGFRFNMGQLLAPAFAILFYICGVVIEKAKPNWFVGIRTPWTLSSDEVWEKTHRLGGKLLKASGIISLFGIVLTDYAFILVTVPAVLSALYLVAYSYLEYRKLGTRHTAKQKKKNSKKRRQR